MSCSECERLLVEYQRARQALDLALFRMDSGAAPRADFARHMALRTEAHDARVAVELTGAQLAEHRGAPHA
jgi:uncharacterized protein HemY